MVRRLTWGVLLATSIVSTPVSAESTRQIETVQVTRRRIVQRLVETGTIQPARLVAVRSRLGGHVVEVRVATGERVERGQVLAVLDVDPAEHIRYLTNRVAVLQDSIAVEEQAETVRTQERYARQGSVAARSVQVARARLEVLRAKLALSRAQLEIYEKEGGGAARVRGGQVTLTAPASGTVLRRSIEEGEIVRSAMVGPGLAPELFLIGDLGELVVTCKVDEMDVNLVQAGSAVEVRVDAIGDRTFEGVVEHVAPAANETHRAGEPVTYDVRVRLTTLDAAMRPGMSCAVDLVVGTHDGILALPVESVRPAGEGRWEVVLPPEESGRTRSVPVELGVRDERFVEIRSGVEEGTVVLRYPSDDTGPELPDRALLGRVGGDR